jgi:hypothetical protein
MVVMGMGPREGWGNGGGTCLLGKTITPSWPQNLGFPHWCFPPQAPHHMVCIWRPGGAITLCGIYYTSWSF